MPHVVVFDPVGPRSEQDPHVFGEGPADVSGAQKMEGCQTRTCMHDKEFDDMQ
jgi:hypothetical protein